MYGNNFCSSGFGLAMGHGPWMLFILVLGMVTVTILFSRGRTSRPENMVNQRVDEALELLRRRYAAGELSEEDFQVMKIKLQA